jgi:hypothetical protein
MTTIQLYRIARNGYTEFNAGVPTQPVDITLGDFCRTCPI